MFGELEACPSERAILKAICGHQKSTSYDLENKYDLKINGVAVWHATAVDVPKKLEEYGLLKSHEVRSGHRIKIQYEPTPRGLTAFIRFCHEEKEGLDYLWSVLKNYKEFSNPILRDLMESAPDECKTGPAQWSIIDFSSVYFNRHRNKGEPEIISTEDILDFILDNPFEIRIIPTKTSYWGTDSPLRNPKNNEAKNRVLKVLRAHKEEVLPILKRRVTEVQAECEEYVKQVKAVQESLSV